MRARFASVVLALLVLTGTMTVGVSPAHAAGCFDWGCDGKDPQAYGCSADAFTIENFSYGGAYLELRYSPACRAAWTRSTSNTWYNTVFAHIDGWDQLGGGNLIRDYWAQVVSGTTWTAMVPFDLWVQSCVGPDAWGAAYPGQCTSRH